MCVLTETHAQLYLTYVSKARVRACRGAEDGRRSKRRQDTRSRHSKGEGYQVSLPSRQLLGQIAFVIRVVKAPIAIVHSQLVNLCDDVRLVEHCVVAVEHRELGGSGAVQESLRVHKALRTLGCGKQERCAAIVIIVVVVVVEQLVAIVGIEGRAFGQRLEQPIERPLSASPLKS